MSGGAPLIVGAGLAGLIAGHLFPTAKLAEREPEPRQLHNALLRFRSDAISLITGIPFRRVRVHKAIWCDDAWQAPNPRLANMYARKVVGRAVSRSIWDTAPVDRYVAPEDFYMRLVDACRGRIEWGADATLSTPAGSESWISTIPMNVAVGAWLRDGAQQRVAFGYAPIHVQRIKLTPGTDIHQTVYLPDPLATSTYRVSVTGATMIVESMNATHALSPQQATALLGLSVVGMEPGVLKEQRYGKIAPIDDTLRKEFIHQLSVQRNIYSLGRFATWRNILLDDVVADARVIKAMIEAGDTYSRRLQMMT